MKKQLRINMVAVLRFVLTLVVFAASTTTLVSSAYSAEPSQAVAPGVRPTLLTVIRAHSDKLEVFPYDLMRILDAPESKYATARVELTYERYFPFYCIMESASRATSEEVLEVADRIGELTAKERAVALAAFYVYLVESSLPTLAFSVRESTDKAFAELDQKMQNSEIVFVYDRFRGAATNVARHFPWRSRRESVNTRTRKRLVSALAQYSEDEEVAFFAVDATEEEWEASFRKTFFRWQFVLGNNNPFFRNQMLYREGETILDGLKTLERFCSYTDVNVMFMMLFLETDESIVSHKPIFDRQGPILPSGVELGEFVQSSLDASYQDGLLELTGESTSTPRDRMLAEAKVMRYFLKSQNSAYRSALYDRSNWNARVARFDPMNCASEPVTVGQVASDLYKHYQNALPAFGIFDAEK